MRLGLCSFAALALALAALASGCGDDAAAPCDGPSLESALAAAHAGDTVRAGACRIEGTFRVPAGVTLTGEDGATVLVAPRSGAGVVLLPSSDATAPTRLEHVTVEATGAIGVVSQGAGASAIASVTVHGVRGVALGASGVTSLALTDVTLEGPITEATASDPRYLRVAPAAVAPGACPTSSCECTPGETSASGDEVCDGAGEWATLTATTGLLLSETGATLERVTVRGFAMFGAVLRSSTVTWRGGGATDTLGVGLFVDGGAVTLEGASIDHTLQGLRVAPPFGIVASAGAALDTTDTTVSDNDRYGVVHVASTGTHDRLIAERNGDAAVWIGDSDGVTLRGEGTRIASNAFAGVVLSSASGVTIEDAQIAGTMRSERALGPFGTIQVGDGLHVHDSSTGLRISRVALSGHERAGIVLDLGGASMPDVVFDGVTADASGTALGAVAGSEDPSTGELRPVGVGGWDSGIERLGAAVTNDASFTTPLDAVLVATPASFPDPREDVGVIAPMY